MDISKTKSTQSNQSTEKLLAIVELLAENGAPMRLLDISKMLGINSSTALRFLTSLIRCGYAAQDEETSKYYLTFKICSIANKVSAHINVRDIANPYMKELSQIFGESVCLAIEQDMKVVYVDVVEGPDQMLRTMQRIGNVAPMHCTGIGKLFLLDYTAQQIDHLVEVVGLKRFTEYTLTSKQQLLNELEVIHRQDYAYDNQECEVGARCIAFPVRDHTGKIIAGISVTGPIGRLTDSFVVSRLDYLRKSAHHISQKMGYNI